jgi:hypothetical protein
LLLLFLHSKSLLFPVKRPKVFQFSFCKIDQQCVGWAQHHRAHA